MRLTSLLAALTAVFMALGATTAQAEEKADAMATIAKATATVDHLHQDEHFPDYWQPSLAQARAVLIIPSFYKAGFFVGGAYGNGILLVRNNEGKFSPPAFYRMAAGSLGIQFGAEEREIMFMIMTDNGLKAIMEDHFKVGAGVNLSIATFGAGAEASTTTGKAVDIVAFSHGAGAFGGGAIEGAGIEERQDWNHAVYGPNGSPRSILFDRRYTLPGANPLIEALNQASQPPHAKAAPTAAAQPATAPSQAGTPVASQPAAPVAAPVGSVETQSLDTPSASSSSSSSSSSGGASSTSGPVKLVPQNGTTLQ